MLLSQLLAIDVKNNFAPANLFKNSNAPANQSATIGDVIGFFLPYATMIAALIFVGIIIWNGFNLATSAGDPKKVGELQSSLTAAVIGLILIVCAYLLTAFVSGVLNVQMPF